jgi:Mycotoxin biosynthesis protein UstYa
MKPTILTIDTTHSSPNLPIHYAPTSTTSRSRKTPLVTLLALATISTLTILYLHPPSTTLLPHMSASHTTPKTFIPNPAYNDLSPSADGNWSNLLPPNGGFFSTKVGEGYEMVGLTMFHQLHCLSMIRGALQGQKMESSKGRVVAGTDRRRSEGVEEDLFGVRKKREVKIDEDLFGVRRKRDVKRGESEADLFGVRRKREERHEGKPEHYLHCFDYLVQVC